VDNKSNYPIQNPADSQSILSDIIIKNELMECTGVDQLVLIYSKKICESVRRKALNSIRIASNIPLQAVGLTSLNLNECFTAKAFFLVCAVGLWVLRPLLAYCTSPG
jgi:hypothetical protein